jgi:hypothetical protein
LLLKSCHTTFSVILTKLANVSFTTGIFSTLYKCSQITPLLKSPSLDPCDAANFRPISNLRTLGKLLERLAQYQLRPHLLSSPAFSPYQSAYRPSYSTETATLFMADHLFRSSSRTPSILVSLDLSSAFDCVLHPILLDRLSADFGVSGLPHCWLQSYLTSRSQFVAWEGVLSSPTSVSVGVPQGSVIGPLLFCVYISPVSRLFDSFGLVHHFYADDSTFFLTSDPIASSLSLLENCSSALSSWFLFNGLLLNPSKSQVLLVGTRDGCKSVLPHISSDLTLAGSPLPLSFSVKILGVTFDSSMSFDAHVSEICRTANYHLCALSHVRGSLSVASANLIACTIVSARLDYCNSILSCLSAYNLSRLQRVQNRAARIVLGVGSRISAEPLLRQLHWLPVAKRIKFKSALITYKTLLTSQPPYLSSLLHAYQPSRSLRSASSNFLSVPRVPSVFESKAFSIYAPHLWNSLPSSLRAFAAPSPLPVFSPPSVLPSDPLSFTTTQSTIPNLPAFKRLLKAHLFDAPLVP